jgi:hypothetical protein
LVYRAKREPEAASTAFDLLRKYVFSFAVKLRRSCRQFLAFDDDAPSFIYAAAAIMGGW